MQKDLTEVKIFQKALGGATFFKHPVHTETMYRKQQFNRYINSCLLSQDQFLEYINRLQMTLCFTG